MTTSEEVNKSLKGGDNNNITFKNDKRIFTLLKTISRLLTGNMESI